MAAGPRPETCLALWCVSLPSRYPDIRTPRWNDEIYLGTCPCRAWGGARAVWSDGDDEHKADDGDGGARLALGVGVGAVRSVWRVSGTYAESDERVEA